ncbi:MAG: protein-ADP-ribose hydrolase [Eggerthellaceae bacterium]|nr:protein-ADP-ribose hydrolase [Eggerthellaceae bacterium]
MNTASQNSSLPASPSLVYERIITTLPQAVSLLLAERGQAPEMSPDPQAQWELFRALVNTRMPQPASPEFLTLQDQLLQDILTYRGVVDPSALPVTSETLPIKLWQGDITTLATDAIVNAANSQMLGCFVPGHHCIDNAIHTFAGVQLRLKCARLMAEQGYPEPTGMAKVTDAFNLPSKTIIHTVGPIAEGNAIPSDCALLANCYTACLDAALNASCTSIAFCCISTGVFGFPQERAARIAVSSVVEWLKAQESACASVPEVIFNVFLDMDRACYEEILKAY